MRASTDSSLAAEVYGVIRRRILRGDLVIGEPISRRKVAADLSMSLPPVTEALLRLECEGLLEHRARAGTRVRIPSPEDVRGHYVVREALEVQAAVLFTQLAHGRERVEVQKLAARVDALADEGDRHTYAAAHQKLHMRIAECSRCPALVDALEKISVLAASWIAAMRHPSPDESPTLHQDFAEAVVHGDGASAAEAVRQHIAAGMERSLAVLEPYFRARHTRGQTFARTRRIPA
jgi:DNA-binding GntR family transcriptional regulator